MTRIRVNPISVRGYGAQAQANFDGMRNALVQTVDQVSSVHYYGPNATKFKMQCGLVAVSFANQLSDSMQKMADAVRASTTNIANSLGGGPVTIAVETHPISPPFVPSVDYVDLDTSALEALKPLLRIGFDALRTGLKGNLDALIATDWTGNAKDSAVESVTKYTAQSTTSCGDTQKSLEDFISDQLLSAIGADK